MISWQWGACWALGAAVCWSGTAKACSCVTVLSASQMYESASAVFVGRVVSRTRPPDGGGTSWRNAYSVEFAVSDWFKGPGGDRVVVVTGDGRGDCGVAFEVGETYLVYAFGSDPLVTHLCSRTGPLWMCVGDIRELERHRLNQRAHPASGVVVVVAFGVGLACGRRWSRSRATPGHPGAEPGDGAIRQS